MTPDPIDHDFLRFVRTRSPDALAAVFDAAAPRLLLVAMHLCRDAAAAEDLVQTVFLQALRDAGGFTPGRPVLPWLLGILEHRASDLRQSAHRRRERAADPTEFEVDGVPSRGPTPDSQAITAEVRQRLAEALAGMPRDYRDVLTLRLVHGLAAIDIAHAHGLPPATVRTRLRRGLALLRAALPRGLATPGLIALLGSEFARAQNGLATVRANVLAAAGAGAGAAVGSGFLLGLAAALLLGTGAWWWTSSQPRAPIAAALPPSPAAVAALPSPGEPAGQSTPLATDARVAAESLPDPRRTSLTGRVVDATSRTPVAGVRVALSGHADAERGDPDWDWQDPPALCTDADGTFALPFVPPSTMTFEVQFSAPAHVTTWRSFGALREGVHVDLGDVAMQPGTPVRLRVTAGGQPVGHVETFATHAPDGARPNSMSGYERTDAEGVVDLGVCAPGTWFFDLRTSHVGNEGRFDVPLHTAPLEVPIALGVPPRERSLAGFVVDTAGAPVVGIELAIPASSGGYHHSTTSRSDGAFLIAVGGTDAPPPLPTKRLALWGNQPEFALVDDGGDVAWGRHDLRLVVRRRQPATLRLEVVDAANGAPIEHYAATSWLDPWATGVHGQPPQLRRERPMRHANGVAVLAGLAAGARFVSVFPPEPWAEHAEQPVELREGEERTLRIALDRPAELTVTALDAATGRPLPGIEIALAKVVPASRRHLAAVGAFRIELARARRGAGYSTAQNTIVMARATTGDDGLARLLAPPDLPGLVLFAEGPRCIAAVRHDVELPRGGAATTIAVARAGEVRGTLGPASLRERCGPTERARASAATRSRTEILLGDEFAEDRPRVELRAPAGRTETFHAHVAPDGSFAIGSLPPGRYDVWVQLTANEMQSAWTQEFGPLATIDVDTGDNPPLTLDLPQLVPSRATVRFLVDGAPWHGPAGLRQIEPTAGTEVDVLTARDGTARTDWLAPGRWVPFVHVVDADGERRAIVGSDPIVVSPGRDAEAVAVLQRRRVELTVRDAAGAPLPRRWLQITPVEHPGVARRTRIRTDSVGRIVLDPAPPGRLAVAAWAAGHGPDDDETAIALGEVAASATTATFVVPQ